MNRGFYPRAFAALLTAGALAACGGEEPAAPQTPGLAEAFAVPPGAWQPYEPPAEGGLPERYVSHLRSGSSEALQFALERLGELGAEAAPAIEAALREHMHVTDEIGLMQNLCKALGATGHTPAAPVLLEVLDAGVSTVVRSAALESLAQLNDPGTVDGIIEHLEREAEAAPRGRAYTALGRIGTPRATAYLEVRVEQWLDGTAHAGEGAQLWNALLLIEGEHLAPALRRLDSLLPPFQRVQALAARIEMGERDLAEELLPYLDHEVYPTSNTRELAVAALAELGAWDAVLEAGREDPSAEMRMAVVSALRAPEAAERGVGEDLLVVWAEQRENFDLMVAALRALVERGQRYRLDPWLQAARGFPVEPGSVGALQVLTREGLQDPRTAGILVERWPHAEGAYRRDLVRALVRTGGDRALEFLEQVARDESLSLALRATAATVIANFDERAVGPLLRIWEQDPGPRTAGWVLPGLGRAAQDPRVAEFYRALAADPQAEPVVRRRAIDLMPKVFDGGALGMWLGLRAEVPEAPVQRYLDVRLAEYF